ncbi:hypothetical protein D3C76_954650 [compost metagenome]
MAAEMGQRGEASPIADETVRLRLQMLGKALGETEGDAHSIVMLSTLVGALLLSRSVQDGEFSDHILDTVRAHLKQQSVKPASA